MHRAITLSILVLFGAGSVAIAADTDFKVSKMHLDQTQQPKDLLAGITDIKNSPVAMAAINAAASYIGVSPTIVTIALNAIPTGSVAGEEGHYNIPVENGYRYCRSK